MKITLNKSWYLYYGRRLGMSKEEILCTPYGEMMDLIACMAIAEGGAKPKPRRLSFQEILALR